MFRLFLILVKLVVFQATAFGKTYTLHIHVQLSALDEVEIRWSKFTYSQLYEFKENMPFQGQYDRFTLKFKDKTRRRLQHAEAPLVIFEFFLYDILIGIDS
jgi:hypothetical protein